MTQPVAYERSTAFAEDESSNVGGRSTVRTTRVDAELDAIALTLSQALANLEILQRDDTKLRDNIVELHTLSSAVLALLASYGATPRGAWVTATAYAYKDLVSQSTNTYMCVTAHTSGVFATDSAAGRWILFSLGTAIGAGAVTFAPTATISATNVQAAIEESDTENRALSSTAQATANAAVPSANLANTASASLGDAMIGVKRTAVGAVATTLHNYINRTFCNATDFMSDAQVADVQSRSLTLDVSSALQAAHDAFDTVYYPGGGYRCESGITLNRGACVLGANRVAVDIYFYGVNGYTIDVSNSRAVTICNVALRSNSAGGAADPRTHHAVVVPGTAVAPVSTFTLERCFAQGWDRVCDWQYTVSSQIDNLETVNCNIGLRLFGQCLNNTVSNSHIVVNSGVSSIVTVKDGSTQGEGLLVSNSILASGQNYFNSDGWLSVGFSNCILDLATDNGFECSGVSGLRVDCPWVFSAKKCFNFADQGTPFDLNAGIHVTYATTTGSGERMLYMGTNNVGLQLAGLFKSIHASADVPIVLNGTKVQLGTLRVDTNGSTVDVTANGADIRISQEALLPKGVTWSVSPLRSVASAATTALPMPTGAQIETIAISGNTGCTNMSTVADWIGKIVVLRFSGTPTWTDGGNLKLNGNFVATADDSLTLVSDGTSWIELARSAN